MTPDLPGVAPVVDAHQHFWTGDSRDQTWRTSDHRAIARAFGPVDLDRSLRAGGIDATVLIQAEDTPAENDRLARYAASTSFVAGVVGWVPLADPERAYDELARSSSPEWRGIRCLVGQDRLDWLTSPAVLELFATIAERGLLWEVVPVTAAQTAAVIELARAVPDLRIVVDHLCRPPVETRGWQPWAEGVAGLARCPSVAMKVSVGLDVLTSWSAWNASELAPYVGWAVEQFGSHRLMLASNWPVVLLRESHARAWADLEQLLAELPLDRRQLRDVRGATAWRWYGLASTQA